jgi:DNA invertase Pin-like site-specific DNA recombinase
MNKRTHVAGYLRVSTEEQARSGLGLDAQRAAIEAEAARRNWHVTWYVDEAASGKSLDRPELAKALAALRTGKIVTPRALNKVAKPQGFSKPQALVVAKLDRLSRSLVDFAHVLEQARKQQWALVALDLGVDTTTPAGELVANVMAAVAQWERRVIGQRTSDALRARQANGLPVGRPRSVSDDCLDQLVALRDSGLPFAAIARQLNDSEIPTATGNGNWTGWTVARMLNNHEEVG